MPSAEWYPGVLEMLPGCPPGTGGLGAPLAWEHPMGKEHPKTSLEGTVSLQVSCKLGETSVALQDAVAQMEQLTVANSRLSTGRGG